MFGQAPVTSPFGAPSPAPFGSPAPATGFGTTSTFGQPAATPAPFGGFGQPAAPAPGGFGAAPASGFGAPSAFGQPAAPPSAFGQPAPTPAFGSTTGGFGSAPAPAFGATTPATGGLFGTSAPTPAFGSPAPAPAFGAKPAGGLFGSAPAPTGVLFGSAPAPAAGGLFGGAPAPATPFGASTPSAFGAPAPSTFGAQAPSGFGAPTAGGFGQPQQPQAGTNIAPYQTTSKQDGANNIVLQAITAMAQYEQKSFEELRLEDYLAGNKGTKGQAAPATTGFGGFGAAPQPATGFGAAPAPVFGASSAPTPGGLFSAAPAPAPTGGLFGSSAPVPAFGANSAPAFGVSSAPATGGLFGSAIAPVFGAAPQPAPAFGAAPAPAFGASPAPATGGLFGSAPAPAPTGGLFGAPAPAPVFGTAPTPTGGLFGAHAPAPATVGLFGSTTPAAATGGLFGQPAPAPSLFGQPAPAPATGLFGASPAKPGGLFGAPASTPAAGGLFGQKPAPASGGLFGQTPTPAATGGGPFGSALGASAPAAPVVPVPPLPSVEAVLAQQLAAVENQKKQLELFDVWRGNPPSGSKVVPTSQYDANSGDDWYGGGSSYDASSCALLSYRAAPRSTAKIRPRGYAPMKLSPVTALGKKTGSPILSPNRFVGSATKVLFIKPNSSTPKPKTRLLLIDGVTNGNGSSPGVASWENGQYESPNKSFVLTQELKSPTATNGSQPKPIDSTSPVTPTRVAGTSSSPAQDLYKQVVAPSDERSPSTVSPLQGRKQFVPKLTKPGYSVYPCIAELEIMSEADLAAVAGFKVERANYGSVAWDGAVDVRGVDIDSVVIIESKNVSVYDEAEENGLKPPQGSKLNRPAIITMRGIYPKDGTESSAEAKAKLKKKIEKSTKKMGAELLSFEEESGVWKFRVGHFSRYGLDDDDDDDSDDDIIATPSLATIDDEQESLSPVEQKTELRSASKMHAPIDDDESTSANTNNMSATTMIELNEEAEEEEEIHVDAIAQEGEEAYTTMTEEILGHGEEDVIIPYDEPIVDELEEEMVLFPDEALQEHEWPTVKNSLQIVHMSHTVPSTGICSRLKKKTGQEKMPCSLDFGMRMRRSFRVGWRPDGSFIQLKPSDMVAREVLVQSRPDITLTISGKTSRNLALMRTHQKHSVKVVDSKNDASIFTLPRGTSSENQILFNALKEYSLSSAVSSFDIATQRVISNSFSLLTCLYGRDKMAHDVTVDQLRRVEAVSAWLKGVVANETMEAISAARSSGDIYGSIFAALSGGDIASASSFALESGNPRLSLMLASTGIQVRPFCSNQLEIWQKRGAQPFIPSSILRMFSLASGNLDIENKIFQSYSSSYNIDWRRRFGMYIWSCSGSQDSVTVSSIVKQYGSDVSAGLAPPAIPLYCGSEVTTTSQCVLYQVLNHYADVEAPLTQIVDPSSHSPSSHDFTASFHIAAAMTALSSSRLSLHEEDLIVDAVASQLVSDGFWEWAVYASLCVVGSGSVSDSSASARRLRAKNIISRFYSASTDSTTQIHRSFLENMGIPHHWLAEASAHRCASVGDILGMVENLWFSVADSMAAMEAQVIPHMLLEGKDSTNKLWQCLESLRLKVSNGSIDCWNKSNGCGMIHKFLELYAQVKKLAIMLPDEVESSTVDIELLLDEVTDLEISISGAEGSDLIKSPPTFAKIPYGFTRTPLDVVVTEMGSILSLLRIELLSIKGGQPAQGLNQDSSIHLKYPSQLALPLSPDSLFDSYAPMITKTILHGFCGFEAMD